MDENRFDGILHSPVGTRDIYDKKCLQKIELQEKIHEIFKSYGFSDMQTPTFEYFDVFGKEKGTVSSRQLYKFFDRDNNTLVLRPDITPSIARCIAKYYKDEDFQIRKCYIGNTFVNVIPYKGKLVETTQAGAELFNDETSDADAEMIALCAESLLNCGLKDFQIEVGHSQFFKGLFEELGLDDETAFELKSLIEMKNFFGVEALLDSHTVDKDLKEIFIHLPDFQSDFTSACDFVLSHCKNEKVNSAIDRLSKVFELLKIHGVEDRVTIDLSMLSKYDYYTGVIFKAYTYGNGEALASGGRYDKLVQQFGKDAPAIGIGINVDELLIAMRRQNIASDIDDEIVLMVYERSEVNQALKKADELRKAGKKVSLLRKSSRKTKEDYEEFAARSMVKEILFI